MVAVTLTDDVENIAAVRTDVLSELWRFYTSNKEIVNDGRRFENLFWRVWAAERIERTISGSRMGSIFRTIAEGEEAFQRSKYHIPPLRRPPTPPTTPVYTSPGSSLPSQFSASVLQQALMSPSMMTSPPLPPQVPPPSPAPSTQSLNMLGKELEESSGKAAMPRRSALKQDRTTSSPLPATVSKPKKKAAFQIDSKTAASPPQQPPPPLPAALVEDQKIESIPLDPKPATAGGEKRPSARRGNKSRASRPKFVSRTSSSTAKKISMKPPAAAPEPEPKAEPKHESSKWQDESSKLQDEASKWTDEPDSPSQGQEAEDMTGNWVVDPGFRLKFKKSVEIEQRIVAKALPTVASVQDTAVLVTHTKGETKYAERTSKAKYRDGVQPLKGEDGGKPGRKEASEGLGMNKSAKKSQLSLLFQDATSKRKGGEQEKT